MDLTTKSYSPPNVFQQWATNGSILIQIRPLAIYHEMEQSTLKNRDIIYTTYIMCIFQAGKTVKDTLSYMESGLPA